MVSFFRWFSTSFHKGGSHGFVTVQILGRFRSARLFGVFGLFPQAFNSRAWWRRSGCPLFVVYFCFRFRLLVVALASPFLQWLRHSSRQIPVLRFHPRFLCLGCLLMPPVVLHSVGFCGSRSLPASFQGLVASVASACQVTGARVLVGCAPGADSFVRLAVPGAKVFSVRSGLFGSGRGAYARRSAALIRSLGSGSSSAFVGFVQTPCPSRLRPSASPGACFCGAGSGSWASLALAAGSGVGSVVVFWCSSCAPSLPGWWPGSWVPASGLFVGGWGFAPFPRPVQKFFI